MTTLTKDERYARGHELYVAREFARMQGLFHLMGGSAGQCQCMAVLSDTERGDIDHA